MKNNNYEPYIFGNFFTLRIDRLATAYNNYLKMHNEFLSR